ncbi:hypothetical protein DRQ50_08990 [bacterium]|nr:MAG: hypothetical protein DRQ50_08990 [bacterium]
MAHRIIITALLLFSLIIAACSGNGTDRRTIGMQAEADTLVVPDHVFWTVKINHLDPDLQKAKEAVDAKLAAVTAALVELQLVDGNLRTGATRIERRFRRCDDGVNRFSNFHVERTLSFGLDDLGAVDATMDRLVTAGEMEVSFLYEVSDPEAILKQLRIRGMDLARSKAASLAAHGGLMLGELMSVSVSEDRIQQQLYRNRQLVEVKGVAGPEAQRLTTRVSVRYEMY